MSDETELIPFTDLSPTGPMGAISGSGRFARQAVAAAFNIIGGVDSFAEWAKANKTEFYTKLFSKTIGREVEVGKKDTVEDMLLILDGEAEDITDIPFDDAPTMPSVGDVRMMRAAKRYVDAEPAE